MTKLILICDCCEKKLEGNANGIFDNTKWGRLVPPFVEDKNAIKSMDLCNDCINDVIEQVKAKRKILFA